MKPLSLLLIVALFGGVLIAGMAGCGRGAVSPAVLPGWFSDVTTRRGLDFTHDSGAGGRYFMPEQIGSGVAVFDADGDGRQDLYFVQNGGGARNRLWLHKADGTFRDASGGSGLDVAGRGMGAIAGDVTNDGRPEVLVTEYGGARLFLNLGGGAFREITAECGVDAPRWATAASFVDYDRDGWLDLVVGQYLDLPPSEECSDANGMPDFCGPADFAGTTARLFRNLGRRDGAPAFEDTTVRSGIVRAPGPALGVLCADFDGDRWPDIFFADDGAPNRLFMNQRDGTFREEAAVRGLALDGNGAMAANMGVAAGDVNGDALFDVFITHLDKETHGLWVQGPRGVFTEQAAALGIGGAAWRGTGFGAVVADFDHDGLVDLAFVNGAIERQPAPAPSAQGLSPFWAPYAQRAQLFAGAGGGRLREVSAENPAFCGDGIVGRGLVSVDFDEDGALDLVATQAGGRARLFHNSAPKRGRWLSVRALDPALGGRDAIGAEVVVEAAGRRWHRLAQPGQSYLGSHDARAHFGLGAISAVDAIRVVWPDGVEERFGGGPVDLHVTLRKGAGLERSSLAELPPLSPAPPGTSPPAGKRSAHRAPSPAPGSRQWLVDGVNSMLAKREFDEAAPLVGRLLREHGSHPKSWLLAGRLQWLKGDAATAERALQRHLELAPESEQGHFQLGLARLKLERFADAAEAFHRATQLRRDYPAAHFNRALALLRVGDRLAAAAAFREVLRYSPEALEAYLRLASLHLDDGEKTPALRLLREAAHLAPGDPRLRELLSRAGSPR
jgi:enediyne biosynthesis protein E4